MTNFERWKAYMSWCISPESYIDWGYYYLISAALQRRVWFGASHRPVYPNIYVFLVGEAGLGKGLVLNPVGEILRHHKLPDPSSAAKQMEQHATTEAEKQTVAFIADNDYKEAQARHDEFDGSSSKKTYEKPLLIPVAPDTTTYEALVTAMAKSLRRINYKEYNDALGKHVMGIYVHSSMCFCLEEISSLFRKHTEDVVNFLVKVYDCNDYEKDTKTSGKDRIRRPCLNFLGGTTPDFMQEIFSDELFNQGLSSRSFFVFESKNRKTAFRIPELTEEQRKHREGIIKHVELLTRLYGQVTATDETWEFLEEWWRKEQTERSNKSLRLNAYYARKNIHLPKIAMAMHFSESTEMEIPLSTFQKAIDFLAAEEKKMHLALGLDQSNPLAGLSRKVEKYLATFGRKTQKELMAEFWENLPSPQKESMETVLEGLELTNRLTKVMDKHPVSKAPVMYYYSSAGANGNGTNGQH